MVVIGLLDIPPEIQLQIAEFVETRKSLKALSVTSRSLRSIAQSKLFKKLQIDIGTELRGSIGDLLANPRICAAIRSLALHGRYMFSLTPRNDEEQLSLIRKILPEMVGLREVSIYQVNLSKAFLDTFLGVAANTPLQITLDWNVYPYSVLPAPHIPLQISHLDFSTTVDHPSLEFFRSMFHASATTLTGLKIKANGDGLMKLADINLPFLHDLTLMIFNQNEVSRTSAAAFLTAQRAIRKLDLRGEVRPIPKNSPNALPNLQELKAATELVNQLVPGRPVEAIEVSASRGYDEDWFGEEVAQSTVRVRMLRVHLNHSAILDTRMVKRMVTILPFLESLWLPVFCDVSDRFARLPYLALAAHFLQTILNVVEVLTSFKCLKDLHFILFRRSRVWVEHDANCIATKLRKANSSFSYLEVRESRASDWKNTICIWNEVFAVFHQMEFVSAR